MTRKFGNFHPRVMIKMNVNQNDKLSLKFVQLVIAGKFIQFNDLIHSQLASVQFARVEIVEKGSANMNRSVSINRSINRSKDQEFVVNRSNMPECGESMIRDGDGGRKAATIGGQFLECGHKIWAALAQDSLVTIDELGIARILGALVRWKTKNHIHKIWIVEDVGIIGQRVPSLMMI